MSDAISEAPTYGIALLLNQGRFVVPSHQRDYAWTSDEVGQLFDDVSDAIKRNDSSFFLGLLVFLSNGPAYTILDGQQRLATTTIIFAAIRDWLRQYTELAGEAQKIQDWYIGSSELGQKEPTPKLILNQVNNRLFVEFVVKGTAIDDVVTTHKRLKRNDPNRVLLEAIIEAHEKVKTLAKDIGDHNKTAEYLFKFVTYFRDNIQTVRLVVANESAAFTLFETLNDRGVDLSPLDLVKNFLFKQAAGKSPETSRDMQGRWIQMIQTLINVKATSFLKSYWTSRHGRIRTNLLFDTFRTTYADTEKAINLSIDLLEASEQYAALDSSNDVVWAPYSPETRTIVSTLKLLGSQQAHPVILSALKRFSVSEMQKLMWLLEVLIVRFLLIGGGNTGRWEPLCARLAKLIYDQHVKTASQALVEMKDVYPTDEEFENAFKMKRENTNQKAQYFLKKLEKEAQWQAKGEMTGEWEPGVLTVEHIMPRKQSSNWAKEYAADPELLEECSNRLGNMCLLTEVNRKLGDKHISDKTSVYAMSELLTTKSLGTVTSWNRTAIEDRQAYFAELAKNIWKFK